MVVDNIKASGDVIAGQFLPVNQVVVDIDNGIMCEGLPDGCIYKLYAS